MKALANILVVIAVISIIAGVIVKLGILAPFSVLASSAFNGLSLLRFANSCLLLAIALFLAQMAKTE